MTTPAALDRLETRTGRVYRPAGPAPTFTLMMFDSRPDDRTRRPIAPVPFVRFYMVAVVAALLLLAAMLMLAEQVACAADRCAQALTGYDRALTWLAYQLVWRDAPNLVPASELATAIAVPLALLLPTVALVAVVALVRRQRFEGKAREDMTDSVKSLVGTTRVLIVTVADVERDAVLDVISGYLNAAVQAEFGAVAPVFRVPSPINDTALYVVQAGAQGTNAPSGVPTVTADAIRSIEPHYALIVGMCYGLKPDEQALGDVLVAERTQDVDHAKLHEVDGEVERQDRGENVAPSPILLNACRTASHGWRSRSGAKIHFGLMLAWNKLVNSPRIVGLLRRRYPWAIGGEMEGAGFHAVSRVAGVDSILIKGICDWAMNKTSKHQRLAARNAAEFALHLVQIGALRSSPAQKRARMSS